MDKPATPTPKYLVIACARIKTHLSDSHFLIDNRLKLAESVQKRKLMGRLTKHGMILFFTDVSVIHQGDVQVEPAPSTGASSHKCILFHGTTKVFIFISFPICDAISFLRQATICANSKRHPSSIQIWEAHVECIYTFADKTCQFQQTVC